MKETPFVDYYEVLQISPIADGETIHRVFRLLAKSIIPMPSRVMAIASISSSRPTAR